MLNKVFYVILCRIPYCIFCTYLLLYPHRKRITLSLHEVIPPHLSLIIHSIMAQKESKVIVMIALGSLFFWRLKGESSPFWSPFFYFLGYFRASGYPLSGIAQMVRIGRTSGRGLRGTVSPLRSSPAFSPH